MASTDEKCLAAGPAGEQRTPVEGSHGERRRRGHEILSVQRSHLDRLEHQLTEQLQQVIDEVAQSVRLAESAAGEGESAALVALQTRFNTLEREFTALDAERDQLRKQLEETRLESGRAEQESRVRDALLKDAQGHDEGSRIGLAALGERLADAEARLTAGRERQNALERELAGERDRAAADREETKAQRRRMAREFKQQRAERIAEFDRRKAELVDLAATVNAQRDEQVDSAAGLRAALDEIKAEHAREIEQLKRASQGGCDPSDLRKLENERDDLVKRLAAAEALLKKQVTSGEIDSRETLDLQRRFEMAVDEVRELKHANADFESKLKTRGHAPLPAAAAGGLDWESQKQRLLASLEADDDDDEEAVEKRASIEGTIRITDQIVAQKDRELAELKQLLEENAGAAPAGTVHSAAAAELLDRDEVIRQERERLVQVQSEWREKIGRAEIDVSVERAKIARERAEVDEKIRQFEVERDRRAESGDAADPSKPTRGRWLARLGLKDLDETK